LHKAGLSSRAIRGANGAGFVLAVLSKCAASPKKLAAVENPVQYSKAVIFEMVSQMASKM
ncbi:MAG: hypothetical protein ACD_47C00458G0001, partial [uncultured bacterium]